MIKKALTLLLLAIYMLGINGYAQPSPTTAATSTQAGGTSPQGSGNITAPDLYSGTVNVNVPIYNYSVDGLDLGASLSYNTLGIQVNQTASVAGLGWNLNTGAYITRQVYGIPDEITLPALDTLDNNGNLVQVTSVQSGYWTNCFGGAYPINPETQPDDFSLVLGSQTIHFLINLHDCSDPYPNNSQFKVYTSPKKDITIEVGVDNAYYFDHPISLDNTVGSNQNTGVVSFKVIDEKGNQYFFQRGDYEIKKYSVDNSPTAITVDPQTHLPIVYYYYPTSRWVISKIITYTGQVINYDYTNFVINYPYYQDQRVKETSQYTLESSGGTALIGGSLSVQKDATVMYNGNVNAINKITYPNGTTLNFNYDNNARCDLFNSNALSNIVVQSKYDNTVGNSLTYNFNYTYFSSNASVAEMPYSSSCTEIESTYGLTPLGAVRLQTLLRLKLLSITKMGTDQVTTEPYYSFGYNSTPLPPRLSPSQDYYGYYNGQNPLPAIGTSTDLGTMTTLQNYASTNLTDMSIPYHTFVCTNSGHTDEVTYGTSRGADINHAQAGILNNVTNGLGGQTSFTYQSATLSNPPEWNTPFQNTGYYDNSHQVPPPYNENLPPNASYLYAQNDFDGLCINTISSSDGYGNNSTTTYSFSGGERLFAGGYFWYPTIINQSLQDIDFPSDVGSIAPIEKIWENSFVTPMDLINGANHGFSSVTTTTTNANSDVLSSKKYTFTNLISQAGEIDGEPGNISRLTNQYGFLRGTFPREYFKKNLMGLPIETDEFDNNGNVLTKTINTYFEKIYADSMGAPILGTAPIPFITFTMSAYDAPTSVGTRYSNFNSSIPLLKSTLSSKYLGNGGQHMDQRKNYYYDNTNANNLTLVSWKDSKGDTYNDQYSYFPVPYSFNEDYAAYHWTYTLTTYQLQQKVKWLIAGSNSSNPAYEGTDPSSTGNNILLHYTRLADPVWAYNIGFMQFPGVYTNTTPYLFDAFHTSYDYPAKHFDGYDDHNNVIQTSYDNNQKHGCAIWDVQGEKIADVANCFYTQMAYTSFEGNFKAVGVAPDYSKGNWTFDPTNIVTGNLSSDKAMTGRYYYLLSPTDNITSTNEVQDCILSFWCNNVPDVWLASATATVAIPMTLQTQVGNWKLYTAYVNVSDLMTLDEYYYGVSIKITGNTSPGNKIDELRLYPQGASMTTTTYEPLFGPSSTCDGRNNITYYEYDPMGRVKITRDINGNIISLTNHVIQGSDN